MTENNNITSLPEPPPQNYIFYQPPSALNTVNTPAFSNNNSNNSDIISHKPPINTSNFFVHQPGYVQFGLPQQESPQFVYTTTPSKDKIPLLQSHQIIYVPTPMGSYPRVVVNEKTPPGVGIADCVLILYILGCFFYICCLPSIIFSLVLVSKKIIPRKQRAAVIACCIFELLAWVLVPALTWVTLFAILVWFVFNLAFGIPRVLIVQKARNNFPYA